MGNQVQVKGVTVLDSPKQTTILTAGKTATAANVPMVKSAAPKSEFREKGLHEDLATYNKAKASHYLNKDLQDGKLVYVPATKILGMTFREQHYEYHTNKNETYGDMQSRYNLSDKCIAGYRQGRGGDVSRYQADSVVAIEEADMEKATGKKIFHAAVED